MTSEIKLSVVLPVLAPTPFLRAMTEFAIKTLRAHADNSFELIVVEAVDNYFDPKKKARDNRAPVELRQYDEAGWEEDPLLIIDKYLRFNPKIGGVKELNAGVDAASGDIILSTGNDVIAPPHWDTELLRCFERKDCAVASLSAFEPGNVIGPRVAEDRMVEGMYSLFMAFRRGWRFDEDYVKIYQDSDLIMRVYESGQRAYRSCRAHVHHLLRMTSDRVEPEQHALDLARDERLFYKRWGQSPLAMFAMIRTGVQVYGRESEGWTNPISLHYDPSKDEE